MGQRGWRRSAPLCFFNSRANRHALLTATPIHRPAETFLLLPPDVPRSPVRTKVVVHRRLLVDLCRFYLILSNRLLQR